MTNDLFPEDLLKQGAANPRFAVELVDHLLQKARQAGASDVHLQPTAEGLELRWRIDGVLLPAGLLPQTVAANVVARLKVMAELLTYRNDVPQEGRIREVPGDVEMRLSTFPTLYGEKAVVRLFAGTGRYRTLGDLGLPQEIEARLRALLGETSGAILLCGPAGSGKTTTIYACLRELVALSGGGRSLASLEDPIEVAVPGVAQSQVNPAAGFDLETGLRSLLRQDPEVLVVGEIRDRGTAEVAFQASLTGHLVLTTFHAGSAAGALGRLSDMGIEPYLLRSGILAVVCQRLVRKLCACARNGHDEALKLGLPVKRIPLAAGCANCRGTGYLGRLVLAELLTPELGRLGKAIIERSDVGRLEAIAVEAGMHPLWDRACESIEAGLTTPAEVRRALGFAGRPTPRAD
jgi:type II secretory ATPase GspE/PulE/Tfp pilus assembly ATPase PilB-like protein